MITTEGVLRTRKGGARSDLLTSPRNFCLAGEMG